VKLSIIIPVYNEAATIVRTVEQVLAVTLPGVEKEIIVVDDGSTDGTGAILDDLAECQTAPLTTAVHHDRNRGKGAAILTAVGHVTGDVVIIQDADLEYDPGDYAALLAPFDDPQVQVVYGSRNLLANPRSSWSFYWGGRLLSWVSNLLYGSRITDEATGYKLFRTGLLRELDLQPTRFEFCPEVTGKVLRRGIEIHEVPISYRPRTAREGKKIRWRDGIVAIWTLVRYRFTRQK
jgi:glycosyltransferase involved in cell wall biosynthesis